MDCIECGAVNPDSNKYCGKCGAVLGRTLDETVRKKGFRDRQSTELEITEAVAERLIKWGKWLVALVVLLLAYLGYNIKESSFDIQKHVDEAKSKIDATVNSGKQDLTALEPRIGELKIQTDQYGKVLAGLTDQTDKYQKVNERIGQIQKELTKVKSDVVDLGSSRLKVGTLETTGKGPGSISFRESGCPPSFETGYEVEYCPEGSPPILLQRTAKGESRPVSSLSSVGFQDISKGAKPPCTSFERGTFYVEKGTSGVADKPFVCGKKSDNTYDWVQLVQIK